MNLQKLNPWNWFQDEDTGSLPVRRDDPGQFSTPSANHPIVQLQREIDQLFDNAFRGFDFPSRYSRNLLPGRFAANDYGTAGFQAKVNIASDEKNYHINLEVPGMTEKDISLELSRGKLIVRGEKKEEQQTQEREYFRVEQSYGSFQRILALPEDAAEEDITAHVKNGLLEITLPRKVLPQSEVKRIPINS